MKRTSLILLTAIIILCSSAYAIPIRYDYFLTSAADTIGQFVSELSGRLVYMGMIWTKISNIKYEIYDNLPYFLLSDPNAGSPVIAGISTYFISILEPLYVTAILLTGIYLLFFSGTPQGRMKAKSTLISLVIGMVIISVSTYLIELLFGVSNTLTKNILGQGPLDIGFTYRRAVDYLDYRAIDFMWTNILLGLPFLTLSLLATAGIFIMLAARYFFLIFLTIFFPTAIFLTLFPPTKNIGNTLLRQLIFWTFLPSAYALMLVTVGVSTQNLSGIVPEIYDIISLTGTMIIIASPLIIYGIMDWIGVFVTYTLQFVRLTAPITASAQTAAEQAEDKKKSKYTKSAVGMKGYATVEETEAEKNKEAGGSALGLGGYRTTKTSLEEASAGTQGTSPLKRKKSEYSSMYDDENSVVPSHIDENAGQNKTDSAYGYADEIVPGGGGESRGVGGSMPMPATYKEPQKKENTIRMKIGPKFITSYEVEIAPGQNVTVNVVLVNDEKTPFYRITVYDENLTDSGFDITYSIRTFALKPGEEKAVKIKIAADENMPQKTYEGEIIFKTEKQEVKSILEMKVKTSEEKEKIFQKEEEKETDLGFTHSKEAEEKKEKLKETNIFGEEKEAPAKKKEKGKESSNAKESGKGSSEEKEGGKEQTSAGGKATERETEHRAPLMRTAAQPEMEEETRNIPPMLKTRQPLTAQKRMPKPAKLLKDKDKKEE